MRPILKDGFWKKLHYCDTVDELFLDGIIEKEEMEILLPTIAFTHQKQLDLESRVLRESLLGEPG